MNIKLIYKNISVLGTKGVSPGAVLYRLARRLPSTIWKTVNSRFEYTDNRRPVRFLKPDRSRSSTAPSQPERLTDTYIFYFFIYKTTIKY